MYADKMKTTCQLRNIGRSHRVKYRITPPHLSILVTIDASDLLFRYQREDSVRQFLLATTCWWQSTKWISTCQLRNIGRSHLVKYHISPPHLSILVTIDASDLLFRYQREDSVRQFLLAIDCKRKSTKWKPHANFAIWAALTVLKIVLEDQSTPWNGNWCTESSLWYLKRRSEASIVPINNPLL
jgi:hypothetical protein